MSEIIENIILSIALSVVLELQTVLTAKECYSRYVSIVLATFTGGIISKVEPVDITQNAE